MTTFRKYQTKENRILAYKSVDDEKFKKVYDEWDRINSQANRRIFIINEDNYIKFKQRTLELKHKKIQEDLQDILDYGYIGCVGLAGRK